VNPRAIDCPWTDRVLAWHLDGDFAAELGTWSPSQLAAHLLDCAHCQRELQRARRLDAALAESAGRAMQAAASDGTMERLLASVTTAADLPTAGRPRAGARFALATVGVLAGLAAAWIATRQPAVEPTQVTAATTGTAPAPIAAAGPATSAAEPAAPASATSAIATSGIPSSGITEQPIPAPGKAASAPPPKPHSLRLPRRSDEVMALAELLAEPNPGEVRHLGETLGLQLPVPLGREDAAALRDLAGHLLLACGRTDALRAWVGAVAQLPPSPLLRAQLQEGRRCPQLVQRVRTDLGGNVAGHGVAAVANIAVAARLGHGDLDTGLLHLVHRDTSAVEPIAAALRGDSGRGDAAAFLLEIWRDLSLRGLAADDEAAARSLFVDGGRELSRQLVDLLSHRLQSAERQRCFLALGTIADPECRDLLWHALRRPSQPEAIAAAWALAQLPATELEDLAPTMRRGHEDWLLRASLIAAGCEVAEAWLADLGASDEQLEAWRTAGRSLPRFQAIAALLRERTVAGD
jgi:hypothetical protein